MKLDQIARSSDVRILTAAAIFAGVALCASASPNAAFPPDSSAPRSVQGMVVTPTNDPVSSAIVYLSDTRTKDVESYITQKDGAYRFEQLSPNDDYKLWAQADGKRSKTKILSSFDDRSTFHVILKIGAGNK
jgi:Carboxypeptidase regulatory-like domain